MPTTSNNENAATHRFNLEFSGEIQDHLTLDQVKPRFARYFAIEDADRLARFFSGERIVLRRNLDRKEAAACFSALRDIGIVAELVKVATPTFTPAALSTPAPVKPESPKRHTEVTATSADNPPIVKPAPKQPSTPRAPSVAKATSSQPPIGKPKQTSPAPSKRVMSRLELPQPSAAGRSAEVAARKPKQAGAPNIYQLQAFRNTEQVRQRASLAKTMQRKALLLSISAFILLALLGVLMRTALTPITTESTTIISTVIAKDGGPVILADQQLFIHDRAGVATATLQAQTLGLKRIDSLQQFDAAGNLLLIGERIAALTPPEQPPKQPSVQAIKQPTPQLLRCDLSSTNCQPVDTGGLTQINTLVENPVDGSLILADVTAGQLRKITAQGELEAVVKRDLAATPTLRQDGGLLLLNSTKGPGISVLRYDNAAFGQQLDEILLLPPEAIAAEHDQVGDFVRIGEQWWVHLYHRDDLTGAIYRFDDQWQSLGPLPLPVDSASLTLTAWAEKALLNNGHAFKLERFNAQGVAEKPLQVSPLKAQVESAEHSRKLIGFITRSALGIAGVLVIAGLLMAWLAHWRGLVYREQKARGAPPIDEQLEAWNWVPPAAQREQTLQRQLILAILIPIASALIAVGNGVAASSVIALLLVFLTPAIALALLQRRGLGHLASNAPQLLLVDHRDVYQLGQQSSITRRGNFLIIDDVVLFLGNRWLPGFDTNALREQVQPLLKASISVDRATLWVKLLEARHPFAYATLYGLLAVAAITLFFVVKGAL